LNAAETIIKKGLNVREAESYVKLINEKKHRKKSKTFNEDFLIEVKSIEENLKGVLGTKVRLKPDNKQKGKILIEYYSAEELERILSLLNKTRK
jgi:ParB family chromosome partitioning protein